MEENWYWRRVKVTLTIGEVKETPKRKAVSEVVSTRKKKRPTRHMSWKPTTSYKLLREGTPTTSQEITQLFDEGKLSEEMLYYFIHTDGEVQPNDYGTEKYEAVFQCSGGYIKAQKQHLRQIYNNANRIDYAKRFDILDDGTPYWVDRHLFRVINEKQTKKSYEEGRK